MLDVQIRKGHRIQNTCSALVCDEVNKTTNASECWDSASPVECGVSATVPPLLLTHQYHDVVIDFAGQL